MAGRYCLLVWGDAEEAKGNGRRRWRGVGLMGFIQSSTIILINGIIAIIITKNYLRRFDMEVKDWENLVLNTEVGSHCFVTLIDDKDISRGYAQIRRAEHFGYNICFTRLYGNKFYFEKIKEGRTQQYINRRK